MKYFKVKNKILYVNRDKTGKEIGWITDEPDFIKQLDKQKKVVRLTSDTHTHTIFAIKDIDFDKIKGKSEIQELKRNDIHTVYNKNYPIYYIDAKTKEKLNRMISQDEIDNGIVIKVVTVKDIDREINLKERELK